jgi:hypothetical protein
LKKQFNLRRLLPIGFACIFGLFLLFNAMAGAVMPLPAYGEPWAGVDFDSMLSGDTHVFYGEYEVPFNCDNMGQVTSWDVLNPVSYRVLGEEKNDGYLTLMSDYLVSSQPYALSSSSSNHYDNSYIRKWLNDDFLKGAFSIEEQWAIVTQDILIRAFNYSGGAEETGSFTINGNVATYPLPTTNDKIHLPWGKFNDTDSRATAYWSSDYAVDPIYRLPTIEYLKDGVTLTIYTRLRSPAYRTAGSAIIPSTVYNYEYTNIGFRGDATAEGIMPIFKLDPKKIIFASPIVTATPGPHQIAASPAYPAPAAGTAYKLTVLDDSLDPAAGGIYNGTNVVGINDTLPVASGGQLVLGMEIKTAQNSGYSIRYKIVSSGNDLLGYGVKGGPLTADVNSFTIIAQDLDEQPLANGIYDVYVWLQKDYATTSFASSTPQYFKISVGGIFNKSPVLSNGSASRSSDSAATVGFISDKGGTYYYQVLPPASPTPSAADIKLADGAGAAMSAGQNTINLTTLTAGEQKIHIVGEDAAGGISNVLSVTIAAYSPPIPDVGGGGGGGGSLDATISPTKADFDLNSGSDIPITLTLNGHKLNNLKNGSYTLKEGTDYSISGKIVTFKASYLATLPKGAQIIVFEMNGGKNPQLTVTVIDTTETKVSFAPFIQGFEDNTFRGEAPITREQFVTILYRLKNPRTAPTADKASPSFGDVAPSRWSFDAIEWAKKAGIIEADSSGNFRPAQPLTRAEMAVMLMKAEKLTEPAENIFSDLDGHKDKDAILMAVEAKIFTGYPDGAFKPDGNTTRAEAVAALIRYLLKGEPSEGMLQNKSISFTDVSDTYWAYKYIVLAVDGLEQ